MSSFSVYFLVCSMIAFALWRAIIFETEFKHLAKALRSAVKRLESPILDLDLKHTDADLDRAFSSFKTGLMPLGGRFYSSKQASEIFYSVLSRKIFHSYKALPGSLVGIGLVFTFLGIALVIQEAGNLLQNAGNLEGLSRMLAAAGMKFWTSLSGVALSIICSQHFRSRFFSLQSSLSEYCRKLDYFAPAMGISHLAQELYQMRENELKFHRNVRSFVKLYGRHTGSDGDKVAAELVRIRTELGGLSEKAVSKIVTQATKILHTATSEGMDKIAKPISDVGSKISEITTLFEKVRTSIEAAGASLTVASKEFSTTIGENAKLIKGDLIEASKHSKLISEDFTLVAKDAEKAGKAAGKLSDYVGRLEPALAQLVKIEELPESINKSAFALKKSGDDLGLLWSGYAHKLSDLESRLAVSIDGFPKVFEQYTETVSVYTANIDNHLTQTLELLTQWVTHIEALRRSS